MIVITGDNFDYSNPNVYTYATQIFIEHVKAGFRKLYGEAPLIVDAHLINCSVVQLELRRLGEDSTWHERIELPERSRTFLQELAELHNQEKYVGLYTELVADIKESDAICTARRRLFGVWDEDPAKLARVPYTKSEEVK